MEASEKLYDSAKVGGDVLAYCTRCRMELAHVVISMEGASPLRVLCKTCNGQHQYRRQTMASRRSGPRKARQPKKVISMSALWEQKLSEHNEAEIVAYQVKASFQVGSVIRHTKFGVGIVESLRSGGKILVLFREGEKILIHGMA